MSPFFPPRTTTASTVLRRHFLALKCKPPQQNALLKAKLLHHHLITATQIVSAAAPSLSLAYLPPSPSSVFFWNTLIKHHIQVLHNCFNGIEVFNVMRRLMWKPNSYTFTCVLKGCGELGGVSLGGSVHGLVVVSGFESNVFVCNAVVGMYGGCGAVGCARRVFDEMSERGVFDVVSWNSIAGVYGRAGDYRGVLEMVGLMMKRGGGVLRPDVISLLNALPACASMGLCRIGKEVHCCAIRGGLVCDVSVGNALIDMYAKCGLMVKAERVFEGIKMKDVVSWTAMVTGYSQTGQFDDALSFFKRMKEGNIELDVVAWSAVIAGFAQIGMGFQALVLFRDMSHSRVEPNVVTLVSVLSGCAAIGALRQGKEVHCYGIKRIFKVDGNDTGEDMMVVDGLVDMYSKCNNLDVARRMFQLIAWRDRTVVTWTAMIGGYAQHGDANRSLELFSEMVQNEMDVIPNAFTISCALVACARLGSLRFGREVHAYVVRNRYESAILFVSNCLIDMYVKSGDIEAARVVFDNMKEKNTVSWTSLMTGYGMHGRGSEALQVFEGMRRTGLPIDGVAFLIVLYACSHSGMVDQGINYFNTMNIDFAIIPGVEHYACLVDLLGRAARLGEAMKLIEDMPMEPTPIIWVALLGACRLHSNVDLGEYAANKLSELGYENDGTYTLLSNIYASARRWKDVARIRSMMKNTGITKIPGCSWVQGKKGTAMFFVGDRSHTMTTDIYNTLGDLINCIKVMGYVPETSYALHDVDEEQKKYLLFEHSEKLALAYAILTTAPGAPIRIIKNLRVCGDCHTAISYISKIVPHEIILRDSSRFHHFKNGFCSCREYW
ncbi:hypothetical protein Leryth_004937 [Lithospermum erythrorhizon]|nr:hypothetical protein Leryth_004937 [Lithospermum erythrorhizon]